MYKYPYGDSQQLNLDWILAKLKELEASGVGLDLERVSNALIALTYNPDTLYARYDYAFRNGKLYRCLSGTTGAFDPDAWQEALIGDDLAVLTRWINAIDAAAVVDVKFDTFGTNGKLQQKYHDQYHDVVEVDYTPVQNSKRPLSSNAGYELNGALNSLDSDDIANASQNVSGTKVTDALNTLQGAINQETATRETYVRPNLLDNWYWGGGQFPINQRGQTIQSNTGYFVDRWEALAGISIDSTYRMLMPINTYLWQPLEADLKTALDSKKITFSCVNYLYNVMYSGTIVYQKTPSANITVFEDSALQMFIATDGNPYILSKQGVGISAAKFELGSTQTLAHQENGVWVLNEIPNYQDELVKCMGSNADASDTYANYDYAQSKTVVSQLSGKFPVAISDGGTGATNAVNALYNLGFNIAGYTGTTDSNGDLTVPTSVLASTAKIFQTIVSDAIPLSPYYDPNDNVWIVKLIENSNTYTVLQNSSVHVDFVYVTL